MSLDKKNEAPSPIAERFEDSYFEDRFGNNPQRIRQFELDAQFLKQFVKSGVLCDVGCSTGEFVKMLSWEGETFGMEVNENAIAAASQFMSFEKSIFTEENYFDVVIFRGTIQHVDTPFEMIKAAFNSLKPGGYIVFLATPNTDSWLYRMKLNLPMLDPELNFYIPGNRSLTIALKNFGFSQSYSEFPYWNTPYRRTFHDLAFFMMNMFSRKFHKHAFWKNMMNVAAQKPNQA